MRAGVSKGGLFSPVLLRLYVDLPVSFRHVELHLYADAAAITAASHKPAFARQLPGITSQHPRPVAKRMEDRHQRLEEHCDALRNGR